MGSIGGEDGPPALFELLVDHVRGIRDISYGTAYLEEDEHEDGVGSEANEGRRPALKQERRTFVSQRPSQHLDGRDISGLSYRPIVSHLTWKTRD